ncbi:MAG: RNA-binding cell elongation regulator Jag/EloR [Actinomycetota bacterium]
MREVERSAASVEEAIEAALEELGVSEQEAEVEILREPSKGLLGLRSQDAVVRVRVREEAPDEEALEEQAELASDFLEGLLNAMDVKAEIDYDEVDGVMYVDIVGIDEESDMALLIGKHGQTLDALQELLRTAVQRKTGERCRVMLDIEDYRKRRRAKISERARDVAVAVKRTGKQQKLEPMSSFERKVVHDTVAEIGGVETISMGEDPERRVVIRKSKR